MLIKLDVLEAIKRGEITLQFRRWTRPSVKAGGTLKTKVGLLQIGRITEMAPQDVTAADARKHAVRANIGSHERWLRALTDQLRRRYISQQVTGFQCFGKERLNLAKQHVVTTAYRGHERCAFVWLAGKCGGVDFLDTSSESGVHHQNLHAADIGLGRFYALPD